MFCLAFSLARFTKSLLRSVVLKRVLQSFLADQWDNLEIFNFSHAVVVVSRRIEITHRRSSLLSLLTFPAEATKKYSIWEVTRTAKFRCESHKESSFYLLQARALKTSALPAAHMNGGKRPSSDEEETRRLFDNFWGREREAIEIRNSALHHEGQTHCVIKMPLLQGVELVMCDARTSNEAKVIQNSVWEASGSGQIRDNHHHQGTLSLLTPYRRRKCKLCLIQNYLQMAVPIKREINCTLS